MSKHCLHPFFSSQALLLMALFLLFTILSIEGMNVGAKPILHGRNAREEFMTGGGRFDEDDPSSFEHRTRLERLRRSQHGAAEARRRSFDADTERYAAETYGRRRRAAVRSSLHEEEEDPEDMRDGVEEEPQVGRGGGGDLKRFF